MKYSELVDGIAFRVHEMWRQSRKNENGEYESDWQPITDENYHIEKTFGRFPSYIRQTAQGGYEIDRANTAYKFLPSSMKQNLRQYSNYISQLVDAEKYRGHFGLQSLGSSLHSQYCKMFASEITPELNVPYAELDSKKQREYIALFNAAFDMSLAKDGTVYVGNTIDNIIKYLELEGLKGNNIYYEGFGTILYSKFDNEESCYLKAYGKSKGEVYAEDLERKQRLEQSKARAIARIPEWRDRGFNLMCYKKYDKWVKCVKDRAEGIYLGRDLDEALQIMEGFEKGMTFDEADKMLKDSGHSGASYFSVMKVIIEFSNQGPAFFRHVSPAPLPYETEQYIQEIERTNDLYKKVEEMNAERYAQSKAERIATQKDDDRQQ